MTICIHPGGKRKYDAFSEQKLWGEQEKEGGRERECGYGKRVRLTDKSVTRTKGKICETE